MSPPLCASPLRRSERPRRPPARIVFLTCVQRLELRTRGSLSGPSDVLDTLLSPVQPKDIDPRKYGFRMFSTIKTTDERYAEIVNCALWIASGVWHDDELIIE